MNALQVFLLLVFLSSGAGLLKSFFSLDEQPSKKSEVTKPSAPPVICKPFDGSDSDPYDDLALSLVLKKVGTIEISNSTPELVIDKKLQVERFRLSELPEIIDPCLQVKVEKWLNFIYEKADTALERKEKLEGFPSEFARDAAKKLKVKQELARKLGLEPPEY